MEFQPPVIRGGSSEERLYLHDLESGLIRVYKTAMPDIDAIVARHKSRYHLVAFFCRPGMRVLDFPCGSGYASEILTPLDVHYEGYDLDGPTISYCKQLYQGDFYVGDLTAPSLVPENYDIIACIEGLEHIRQEFQAPLIRALSNALKPTGTLVISCPEAPKDSGPSPFNSCHLWELTRADFTKLLLDVFPTVQLIVTSETLHNGQRSKLLYAICRKDLV